MWWKTTEIYRVSLPYNEILALDNAKIKSTVKISVFIRDQERLTKFKETLESLFKTNEVFNVEIASVDIDPKSVEDLKTPAALEAKIFKKHPQKIGELLLVEWWKLKEEILVTSDRTIFLSETADVLKVHQTLNNLILRENKLKNILGVGRTFDGKPLRYNGPVPSTDYELLISVINPKPDIQRIHWNIQEAVETYVTPFLDDLKLLSNFTVKSQWKYQVSFPFNAKPIRDTSEIGRHFALDDENLPHIITSIESKLGTEISNQPNIHLVVYTPPCSFSPLVLYTNNKRVSNKTIESFISAKWGGIIIANPPESTCLEFANRTEESMQDVFVSSHKIMETVLYQLRKIFELEYDEVSFS